MASMYKDSELTRKLAELSPEQQEVLASLVKTKALAQWQIELARMLGPDGSIPWQLTDVVDLGTMCGKCYRGHDIRYEYHLQYIGGESMANMDGVTIHPGQEIILGSTCIQLATGIDQKVARAVQNKMFEIKSDRDEILSILMIESFEQWLDKRPYIPEQLAKVHERKMQIKELDLINLLLERKLPLLYRHELELKRSWLHIQERERIAQGPVKDLGFNDEDRTFIIEALKIDPNNVWAGKMLYFMERGEEIFGSWQRELKRWVAEGIPGWHAKVQRGRDQAERVKSLLAFGQMDARDIAEANKLLESIEKFTDLNEWGLRGLDRLEQRYERNLSAPVYDYVMEKLPERVYDILLGHDMEYVRQWWEEIGKEDIMYEVERGDFHPTYKSEVLGKIESAYQKALDISIARIESELAMEEPSAEALATDIPPQGEISEPTLPPPPPPFDRNNRVVTLPPTKGKFRDRGDRVVQW